MAPTNSLWRLLRTHLRGFQCGNIPQNEFFLKTTVNLLIHVFIIYLSTVKTFEIHLLNLSLVLI